MINIDIKRLIISRRKKQAIINIVQLAQRL